MPFCKGGGGVTSWWGSGSNCIFGKILPEKAFYNEPQRLDYKIMEKFHPSFTPVPLVLTQSTFENSIDF